MPPDNQTILDNLFSAYNVTCQAQSVVASPDELVHIVGAQEPVRDQPDMRARNLLTLSWLKMEIIRTSLPDAERTGIVNQVQQAARARLKHPTEESTTELSTSDREQVRWLIEKTRSRESKQQIAQRVWLAIVLYNTGCRGLRFDHEGQVHWDGGFTGRIGLAPDAVLDLAWGQPSRQVYAASFRQPDGTIIRGKGRRRWHIYRLTVDAAAAPLFERRTRQIRQKVALIVASETHATQPQLPRDFYGGNDFQQACIDAQDQSFDHMLVLSPEHGILSLDDTVPAESPWDEVMERRLWAWQIGAVQRLGMYLFGEPRVTVPNPQNINWWSWLNPESTYELTVFGGGFAVRILLDHLLRSRIRNPQSWPEIVLSEQRPGYDVGDFDDDNGSDFILDEDLSDDLDYQAALQDIDQLLEWASEFVTLVNIYVTPIGETWQLAPDEALLPVRLLAEIGMDIEDLLDLLTDMSLLLEQSIPISMLINAGMVVSVLLQVAHNLVHNERDAITEMLNTFPEIIIRQYIEAAMQETNQEDQLCACLTLAEQMQLFALSMPPAISEQLLVWLQTYISARMRYRLLGDPDEQTPDAATP